MEIKYLTARSEDELLALDTCPDFERAKINAVKDPYESYTCPRQFGNFTRCAVTAKCIPYNETLEIEGKCPA